jgi:tetratricopeptide (TPR) repeat protein
MAMARTPERFRKGVLPVLVALIASAWGQAPEPSSSPASRDAGKAKVRAVTLYRKGNLQEACPMFTTLAARQPSDPEPHLYLLGCAIRRQNANTIATERQVLDRLAPAGTPLHATAGDWLASAGRCGDAEKEYALAPPPGTAGAVEFALAQCYQSIGKIKQAISEYRKALELGPEREEYYLSLAILLMGVDTDEAGKVLLEALGRFPSSLRVYVTMSLLHLQLGYPDRARIGYEKARALDPESPLVWKLLGRIQHTEGAYEQAVKSFERAAAIEPKDAQTYLFMGLSLIRIQGGADRALEAFLHAIELDPQLLEARFQAASIYLQTKENYAKAASQLEKVVAAAPDFARAQQLLIQAYYRLGWNQKAAAQEKKFRRLSEAAPPGPIPGPPKSP